MVERVLLASPRGYCAGVERAVETVELALDHYGPPVYVRKQIVHNIHVVRELEARGAIFVDSEEEAPPGATIVFSAHGVAPAVHEASAAQRHNVIDATCPLVTKVHVQARRYAADGYTVVLNWKKPVRDVQWFAPAYDDGELSEAKVQHAGATSTITFDARSFEAKKPIDFTSLVATVAYVGEDDVRRGVTVPLAALSKAE